MPWVDSAGFGNAGWSQEPWGDGPYVVFAHTPGYGYGTDDGFLVRILPRADLTEQRLHISRERTVGIHYDLPMVCSAEYQDISSWQGASVGPLYPFLTFEHEAMRFHVTRFASDTINRSIIPVMHGNMGLDFKVCAPYTYPAIISDDLPVLWWRLTGLAPSEVASGKSFEPCTRSYTSLGFMVAGNSLSGMFESFERQMDVVPTFNAASASYVVTCLQPTTTPFAWFTSSQGCTWEVCFAITSLSQGQIAGQQQTSGGWALRVDSGFPTFVYSSVGGSTTLVSNVFAEQLTGHHLVVRKRDGVTSVLLDMIQDGVLVASGTLTTTAPIIQGSGAMLIFGGEGISTGSATAKFFNGKIADFQVYSVSLPTETVLRHWAAFAGY